GRDASTNTCFGGYAAKNLARPFEERNPRRRRNATTPSLRSILKQSRRCASASENGGLPPITSKGLSPSSASKRSSRDIFPHSTPSISGSSKFGSMAVTGPYLASARAKGPSP